MTEKQEKQNSNSDTTINPVAIQNLLEGIDLANRRGAFSIQESGKYAEAYTHVARVLSKISQATEKSQQNNNTNNGEQ